jgi:hypothetical protein
MSLPENWDEMSLDALHAHLNRKRDRAPQATFEAVAYTLRTHGVERLKDPGCQAWLVDLSKEQIRELVATLLRIRAKAAYPNKVSDELILKLSELL